MISRHLGSNQICDGQRGGISVNFVVRAGFAPAARGYEPLVLSYATTTPQIHNARKNGPGGRKLMLTSSSVATTLRTTFRVYIHAIDPEFERRYGALSNHDFIWAEGRHADDRAFRQSDSQSVLWLRKTAIKLPIEIVTEWKNRPFPVCSRAHAVEIASQCLYVIDHSGNSLRPSL
jgi:hypothetical protein